MKTAIFIVGNYGVGKSSLINKEPLEVDDIFIKTGNNIWVLGTNICGADSLSKYKKIDVRKKVLNNKEKNLLITGNYYCQIVDFKAFKGHFNLVLIYLNTSFENNEERIKKRGRQININTYKTKLKSHKSLMENVRNIAKIYILDNNQSQDEVQKEFNKIVAYETN